METPVRNLVASVDLTASDTLRPLFECVVNSVISLKKVKKQITKKIQVHIARGSYPSQTNTKNTKTIENIIIIDNDADFKSAYSLGHILDLTKELRRNLTKPMVLFIQKLLNIQLC